MVRTPEPPPGLAAPHCMSFHVSLAHNCKHCVPESYRTPPSKSASHEAPVEPIMTSPPNEPWPKTARTFTPSPASFIWSITPTFIGADTFPSGGACVGPGHAQT